MQNLIPHFIQKQYKKGYLKGNFTASSMFVDISGFTKLTETLMKYEKDGAEILTEVLNNIFNPIVNYIYQNGGMISTFAGDAFTALFPIRYKNAHLHALQSAFYINQFFIENKIIKTKYADFEMDVKVGLSIGEVNWGILGKDDKFTYFFRGEAVNNCAYSEHFADKGDIIADNKIIELIRDYVQYKPIETHFKLSECNLNLPPKKIRLKTLDKEILSYFTLNEIIDLKTKAEFRNVCSVFISYDEPKDYKTLNQFVTKILELTSKYEAYFNKIDFGDKGGVMLILVGAPISFEKNVEIALDFILDLKSLSTDVKWRAGLTYGIVYAGIMGGNERCEYTAIGDIVNLSARFMMKANWNEILITEKIYNYTHKDYDIKLLGNFDYKGISKPIPTFKLLNKKLGIRARFFEGETVGREAEFEKLKEYSQPILDKTGKRFGGVVYVYGEAGIGKSRLLYEVIEDLKNNHNLETFTLNTDSILKKGLNPFTYTLNNYFKQHESIEIEKRKANFEIIYNNLIKTTTKPEDIKELNRIKSILGAVVGLHWEDSLYERLNPKDKPQVTRFAIKEFFKVQSLIRPIVILIEDIHWLDSESQGVFEIFTRQIENYPIIILASSRFNDDGTKPKLNIDKETLQSEIIIEHLPIESIEKFVENQLLPDVIARSEATKQSSDYTYKLDDNLISFISDKTKGNPFYIEQFCLYLKENELLEESPLTPLEKGGTGLEAPLIKNGSEAGGILALKSKAIDEIPIGIHSILIARIDRLSMKLKEMVQIASVLGREFEKQILLGVIELLLSILSEDKTHLRSKEIEITLSNGEIEKMWTPLLEIKYIFKHALLRDAIYDMQLRARLRNLHNIAGDTIQKLYIEDKSYYADTAYHYEKAENWENAKEYYEKAGDYAKEIYKMDLALQYYNKTLIISLNLFGEKHLDTASSYNSIGIVYKDKANYDKALEYFNKSLAIRLELLYEKHPDTAKSYFNIGCVYRNKGNYDKALLNLNKAVTIYLKALGEKHPFTASLYNSIGNVYYSKGDYDKALLNHNKSLAIKLELLGEKHPHTATSYNNIGAVYYHKGDYDNAFSNYNKGLTIWSAVLGEKHSYTAASYNNIGIVHSSKGDYDKALLNYNKALAIYLETLGEKHTRIADSYNNIGLVHLSNKGDYDKALLNHNKSLAIRLELLGEKHPDTAQSYHNIGEVCRLKGDYDKALEYFNKTLLIRIEALGEKHPYTAATYNEIGNAYKGKGEHNKALEYYNKALDIYKERNDEKEIEEVMKNIRELQE